MIRQASPPGHTRTPSRHFGALGPAIGTYARLLVAALALTAGPAVLPAAAADRRSQDVSGSETELMKLVRELRDEVRELRQEVNELRQGRGDAVRRERHDAGPAPREDGDQPRRPLRRDGDAGRRGRESDRGERPREGDAPTRRGGEDGDARQDTTRSGKLGKIFQRYDADGSGQVSLTEFLAMREGTQNAAVRTQWEAHFDKGDTNGDQAWSYEEFESWTTNRGRAREGGRREAGERDGGRRGERER